MILDKIQVDKIKTISDLAPILSISEDELHFFLDSKDELIKKFLILKKNYDFRVVFLIKNESYRHLLKRITDYLNNKYSLMRPESVHGFVKGKSIFTNAEKHTERKIILNIDIKDFFSSISQFKVIEIFTSLGFTKEIAEIFSKLLTVGGVLATGFSTSPVISNMICVSIDKDFEKLALIYNATYTRYADDITLSSNDKLPSLEKIKIILNKNNFILNDKKIRIYRKGGPQYVTGLTVVDSKPRLSKKFKKSIRLELYYIKKYGITNHLMYHPKNLNDEVFFSRFSTVLFNGYGLRGFIAFINSIEPRLAKKMCFVLPKKEDFEYIE